MQLLEGPIEIVGIGVDMTTDVCSVCWVQTKMMDGSVTLDDVGGSGGNARVYEYFCFRVCGMPLIVEMAMKGRRRLRFIGKAAGLEVEEASRDLLNGRTEEEEEGGVGNFGLGGEVGLIFFYDAFLPSGQLVVLSSALVLYSCQENPLSAFGTD